MKSTTMVKYLGRPLTSIETANYSLYSSIALQKLESILCSKVSEKIDETRRYKSRKDMRSIFIDPATLITEVKVDGVVTTEYSLAFFDDLNSEWYNVIVFNKGHEPTGIVEITGNWGFCPMPSDMGRLLGAIFDSNSKSAKHNGTVQSKQVEDFRITYKDKTLDESIIEEFSETISKYSICGANSVMLHGDVCED